MYDTDKSTPSTANIEDTSSSIAFEDTPDSSGPDDELEAPENSEVEADVTDGDNEDNGLIFGKFKTLAEAHKSYKEAERAITKAAELEKAIQSYEQQSEKYEQEAVARAKGYNDRLAMALENDVRQHELDNYAVAAGHTLPPEQQLEVSRLINRCRMNGSEAELAQLRRCFSPEIVALASEDMALYRNARQSDYDELRSQDRTIRFNRKLGEFSRRYDGWIDSPLKTELISQALQVSDGRVDLPILKELIDSLEREAVKKYQKKKSVLRENSETQDSLNVPGTANVRAKPKKWLTREDFNRLTPEQETEKYDMIVEQVKLEKQGLLPRMLT